MRVLPVLLAVALSWTASAQDPNFYQFLRSFDQAREAGDQAGMEAAVRTSRVHARSHFTALCRDLRRIPDDQMLKDTIAALKAAWAGVYDSPKALDSIEAFVVPLSLEIQLRLQEANQELMACLAEVAQAERNPTRQTLRSVGDRTRAQAELLEDFGDFEHAAEAWGAVARVLSLIPERSPDEQAGMIDALQHFVRLRESWDQVRDTAYAQNLAFLQGQLAAVEAAGPEPVPFIDSVVAGAEQVVAELEFEMLEEMDPDMFVQGGPVPTLWAFVAHTGETVQLPYFKRSDLFLVREANQRFGVASEASATGVTAIEASPRPEPSLFHLDEAKSQPYAMWFFVGGTAERFMEAEINFMPDRDSALVFYRSAASWTTSIAGEEVVFYDDNCDGRLFVADPFELNVHMRTLGKADVTGTRVPAYDSMRVGRGPRIPFSGAVQIKGKWYRLDGLEDGTRVGVRAIDEELFNTGRVELNWTGNRRIAPELLIIQGRDDVSWAAFDIAAGDPVEVPAGEYEISFGRILTGRGDRTRMAQIFRGESETFRVAPGETLALEMGAPFQLEFERGGQDPEIEIDASTMRVLGSSGAQFAMLHGAVLAPDVIASAQADGRGAAVIGGFTPVVDPELARIFAKQLPLLNYSAIAFPRPKQSHGQAGDLVFRLRLPAPGMVVGLRQDRHPLFGKLEPVFK